MPPKFRFFAITGCVVTIIIALGLVKDFIFFFFYFFIFLTKNTNIKIFVILALNARNRRMRNNINPDDDCCFLEPQHSLFRLAQVKTGSNK